MTDQPGADGRFDVVAIGNAIVDVLARVDASFLTENGVEPNVMQLVDDRRAAALYAAMPPATEISGGSAANTAAGLAALGARAAFIGKVGDDQLGRVFAHDIRAQGAHYAGPIAPREAGETGRSLILVTPDGHRSMNTALGVSSSLAPEDIDATLAARTRWLYLEGYLFDSQASKEAYARAIAATTASGGKVAFTASDPFCVDRHRSDTRILLRDHVDLLFANRDELLALYQTPDLEAALDAVAADVPLAAVTLSEEGAIVVTPEGRFPARAAAAEVVDTTGAGDLFAAGFLAGLAAGREPLDCARMGCVAAAEVISHLGARPEADLRALMAEAGL